MTDDHHRKPVQKRHFKQGCREACAEFVGEFSRGGERQPLHLPQPRINKIVGQDEVRRERIGLTLWIQRIVGEVSDVAIGAEENLSAVVMPMTQLMRQRKSPPFEQASAVHGNHGSAFGSDDGCLAAVQGPKIDDGPSCPGDGFQVDVQRERT